MNSRNYQNENAEGGINLLSQNQDVKKQEKLERDERRRLRKKNKIERRRMRKENKVKLEILLNERNYYRMTCEKIDPVKDLKFPDVNVGYLNRRGVVIRKEDIVSNTYKCKDPRYPEGIYKLVSSVLGKRTRRFYSPTNTWYYNLKKERIDELYSKEIDALKKELNEMQIKSDEDENQRRIDADESERNRDEDENKDDEGYYVESKMKKSWDKTPRYDFSSNNNYKSKDQYSQTFNKPSYPSRQRNYNYGSNFPTDYSLNW